MADGKRNVIRGEMRLDLIPIDKIKFFTCKDGTQGKSFKFDLAEMKQPDPYGNTHTIYLVRTREDVELENPTIYIGKGKFSIKNGEKVAWNNQSSRYSGGNDSGDDEPF